MNVYRTTGTLVKLNVDKFIYNGIHSLNIFISSNAFFAEASATCTAKH